MRLNKSRKTQLFAKNRDRIFQTTRIRLADHAIAFLSKDARLLGEPDESLEQRPQVRGKAMDRPQRVCALQIASLSMPMLTLP
ncbi:hypothetical protein ACFQS6_19050 [Xanthomonas populi]